MNEKGIPFNNIVEIWEVEDEEDVNILLRHGWKLLSIVPKLRSREESGIFHSKLVGVYSVVTYIMGRTIEVPARKGWEDVHDYSDRIMKRIGNE